MVLTSENYYSKEANKEYFSVSQYKAFEECEAAAMAEIKGEYKKEPTTAMLVGSYVDAHFEGTLNVFIAQHPEIMKRDGTLKAEYAAANEIIARLESDELFSALMSGKKQVIKTGYIAGVPFKVKIDSLLNEEQVNEIVKRFSETAVALGYPFSQGAIVDLKIMRDLLPVWSDDEHQKIPFIEAYGYDLQGAAYREIDGRELPFVIAAGTKEDAPDLSAMYIPPDVLDAKIAEMEDNLPHYAEVKAGKIPPRRCGKCAWCRSTKKLTTIVPYNE